MLGLVTTAARTHTHTHTANYHKPHTKFKQTGGDLPHPGLSFVGLSTRVYYKKQSAGFDVSRK